MAGRFLSRSREQYVGWKLAGSWTIAREPWGSLNGGGVVKRVQGRGPSWKRVAREVEDTRRGSQVLAAERSGLSKALNSSQVSRGKTMWPESVNLAAALRRKLPLNRGARAHLRVSYARHAFLYLAATIPRCITCPRFLDVQHGCKINPCFEQTCLNNGTDKNLTLVDGRW